MLYCLILLLLLCLSSTYLCLSLNHDATILRQAKLGLSDPAQSLSSWSENDVTPCHWRGITCDATSAVFSVNLSSFMLVGPFPSVLCRLPSLSFLSLYNNSINGSLSGDEFTSFTSFHAAEPPTLRSFREQLIRYDSSELRRVPQAREVKPRRKPPLRYHSRLARKRIHSERTQTRLQSVFTGSNPESTR
ncbi:BnaA01g08410D [Brassica napus]|uniref:BnaA01g08410D protein n=1 Tax=Brassica napus TaxID=3708 RepID=A0A078H9R6_BRANA|nr:BnaA01g08410D [Brassica napus]